MDGADQIFAGPDGTALRFYYQPTKNNFQSEKNGRPIFDSSLMVEVMVPGSRESTPIFEVERVYCIEAGGTLENRLVERSPKYVQFQTQVEAFKAQSGEGLVEGTPIAQWPTIDGGTAATLKAAGIQTVEMLAGVQDGHLQNLGMGGHVLREQARAFIQSRQFGIPSAQMATETANLREENARLNGLVSDLTTRLSTALGEVQALRTGNAGANSNTLDALGFQTISQPDTFASLDNASASPLSPNEGEANEQAKQRSEQMGDGFTQGTVPPQQNQFLGGGNGSTQQDQQTGGTQQSAPRPLI